MQREKIEQILTDELRKQKRLLLDKIKERSEACMHVGKSLPFAVKVSKKVFHKGILTQEEWKNRIKTKLEKSARSYRDIQFGKR